MAELNIETQVVKSHKIVLELTPIEAMAVYKALGKVNTNGKLGKASYNVFKSLWDVIRDSDIPAGEIVDDLIVLPDMDVDVDRMLSF